MKRRLPILLGLALLCANPIVTAQTTRNSVSYSLADRGGTTFSTAGGGGEVTVGYARVQPGSGTTAPAGVAIFGYRANGVLVTEAGVPVMQPILSGRSYAEANGPVNTGLAFANPNSFAVTISYYFTSQAGVTTSQSSFTLNAGEQMARFIHEAPFSVAGVFAGTFTFSASAPVGVISLRGLTNDRDEFLITTQTVASITTSSTASLVMAHFADGGGWKTQIILVNSSDQLISGNVLFYGEGSGSVAATPLTLTLNGQVGVSFNYAIPGRASVKLETSGAGSTTQVGSLLVTPNAGSDSPSGFTLFSLTSNGTIVTQASVSAEPATTASRMYVETSGTAGSSGSIQSGIGITNTSTTTTTVSFELMTLAGASTGLRGQITIPGNGHAAKFLLELFPGLPLSFKGVLRISSGSPLVVVGLRTRYNERGDFLITTTPASSEFSTTTTTDVIFPHIVDMGGYTTQFALFSGTQSQSAIGTVRFFTQTEQAMNVTVQ